MYVLMNPAIYIVLIGWNKMLYEYFIPSKQTNAEKHQNTYYYLAACT